MTEHMALGEAAESVLHVRSPLAQGLLAFAVASATVWVLSLYSRYWCCGCNWEMVAPLATYGANALLPLLAGGGEDWSRVIRATESKAALASLAIAQASLFVALAGVRARLAERLASTPKSRGMRRVGRILAVGVVIVSVLFACLVGILHGALDLAEDGPREWVLHFAAIVAVTIASPGLIAQSVTIAIPGRCGFVLAMCFAYEVWAQVLTVAFERRSRARRFMQRGANDDSRGASQA